MSTYIHIVLLETFWCKTSACSIWLDARFSVFAQRGCKPAHMQHCEAAACNDAWRAAKLVDHLMGDTRLVRAGQLERIGHRCRKGD